MKLFNESFMLGATTSAHQSEGNNRNSDLWVMEQLEHSTCREPSLEAVDHYNRFEEDIKLLADAGLNAYRFGIEWARIQPTKDTFDDKEIEHYRKVLQCCHSNRITPIVCMHHFSSPIWLIQEGGWETEGTIEYFKNYCAYVVEKLGNLMGYVCTINEANMGLQLAALMGSFKKPKSGGVQLGVSDDFMKQMQVVKEEQGQAFSMDPRNINSFLGIRTTEGDQIIAHAHAAAREAMKSVCPHLRIGITLSLYDFQLVEDTPQAKEKLQAEWDQAFTHYLPFIKNDDFFGVQNYTRKLVGSDGTMTPAEDAKLTHAGYENYPQALGNVIRTVYKDLSIPLIVTEHGIDALDDAERVEFIKVAMQDVKSCQDDNIPVIGYLHWSLLDNYEFSLGFEPKYGLIAVERLTQKRHPKASLAVLGSYI